MMLFTVFLILQQDFLLPNFYFNLLITPSNFREPGGYEKSRFGDSETTIRHLPLLGYIKYVAGGQQ